MSRLDDPVRRRRGYNPPETALRGGLPVRVGEILPAVLLDLAAGMSEAEGRRFRKLVGGLVREPARRAA